MSIFSNLDAVLTELGNLGVRAEAFNRDDDGNPGVVVVGRDRNVGSTRIFTTEPCVVEDRESALAWALIVAAQAREVEA